MDDLTFRIPASVTAVHGCDCGGVTMHRTDCTIFAVPTADRAALVTDAEGRIQDWVDRLNATRGGAGG